MTMPAHRRLERRIAVSAPYQDVIQPNIAMTVHLPPEPMPSRPIYFFLPGAGYGRGYFDLQIEGYTGFSQAEYHAAHGFVSVAIDHLGVGESSRFVDVEPAAAERELAQGQPRLTIPIMAAAVAEAVRSVRDLLAEGSLDKAISPLGECPAVGVGQSMGGFVAIEAQAAQDCFDAIALLGSSMTQVRLALQPGRRYPRRDLPFSEIFERFRQDSDREATFHWPETPSAIVDADMRPAVPPSWRSPTIPACSSTLLRPGVIATRASEIRVPVLLAYGEIDSTVEPLMDLMVFRSATDISMYIVPEMAHMHNFAATREKLWRRLEIFAEHLAIC